MATVTEPRHRGEFMVSEANGFRSRENIVVVSGQNLGAGAVVAKLTASGKYMVLTPGTSDGSQNAAGILYGAVDASSADAKGVLIARDAEVNAGEIAWPAGISAGNKTTAIAALAALGIVLR